MATRLGDQHRLSPSDTGKPYHEPTSEREKTAGMHNIPMDAGGATDCEREGLRKRCSEELLEITGDGFNPEGLIEFVRSMDATPVDVTTDDDVRLESVKYDAGKPACAIIDPRFIEGMGQVLAFGEQKYARMNWAGLTVERLMDAHQRHTMAILRGEDTDPESGQRHAHHAACCLMMVDWIIQNREDQDDRRFKPSKG